MSTIEFNTLCKCASQLEAALISDIRGIANDAFSEGLIGREFYEAIMAPKSAHSDADHAAMLVIKIKEMVEQSSKNYYRLINRLRQSERNSGIVNLVDSEYFGVPCGKKGIEAGIKFRKYNIATYMAGCGS